MAALAREATRQPRKRNSFVGTLPPHLPPRSRLPPIPQLPHPSRSSLRPLPSPLCSPHASLLPAPPTACPPPPQLLPHPGRRTLLLRLPQIPRPLPRLLPSHTPQRLPRRLLETTHLRPAPRHPLPHGRRSLGPRQTPLLHRLLPPRLDRQKNRHHPRGPQRPSRSPRLQPLHLRLRQKLHPRLRPRPQRLRRLARPLPPQRPGLHGRIPRLPRRQLLPLHPQLHGDGTEG